MKGIDGWDDWDDMYFYDYVTGGNVLGVFRDPKHEDAQFPYRADDDDEEENSATSADAEPESPVYPELNIKRNYRQPTPEQEKKVEAWLREQKALEDKQWQEREEQRAKARAEREAYLKYQRERENAEYNAKLERNLRVAEKYSNALRAVLDDIGAFMRG